LLYQTIEPLNLILIIKEPIVYPQDSTATKQHECRKKQVPHVLKTGAACSEQYVFAVMHNIEDSYTAQQKNEDRNSSIRKQADIHCINAKQKSLTA
jgi:hypothetical protein